MSNLNRHDRRAEAAILRRYATALRVVRRKRVVDWLNAREARKTPKQRIAEQREQRAMRELVESAVEDVEVMS